MSPTIAKDPNQLRVMSFGDHLEELRFRLFRSLAVLAVAFAFALVFQGRIMEFVTSPHQVAMTSVGIRYDLNRSVKVLTRATANLESVDSGQARSYLAWRRSFARDVLQIRDRIEERASGEEMTLLVNLVERLSLDRYSEVDRIDQAITQIQALLDAIRADFSWAASEAVDEVQVLLTRARRSVALWLPEAATVPSRPPALIDELRRVRQVWETERDTLVPTSRGDVASTRLHTFAYPEYFFAGLKVSAMVALIVCLPWLLLEMWRFVAAGLYERERKSVRPFLPLSLLFLVLGATFAYQVMVPVGLSYLGGYGAAGLAEPTFRLSDYISLVFVLIVGMALVFQLPLVMVFLTKAQLVEVAAFRKYRRFAIVGSLVLGSLFTPPDVVTQLLMAGPLVLLYEFGILVSLRLEHRRRRAEAAEAERPGGV